MPIWLCNAIEDRKIKGGYLQHFFSKRFSKILYPYLAFVIMFSVVSFVVNGTTINDILNQYRWGNPVSNSWYVIAILVFYVLFYVSNRIKGGKKSIGLIFVFTFVYISILIVASKTFSTVFDVPDFYYRTLVLFPIGCFIGKNKSQIEEYLEKRFWLVFVITSVILIIGYLFPSRYFRSISKFIALDKHSIQLFMMGLFGTLEIMLLLKKISLSNKLTQFLGKYSFEIYLIHGMIIMCFSKYFEHMTFISDEVYTILVVMLTVLVSVPLKVLFDWITKITCSH